MAKSRYEEWLEPDGLLKLEAWARDGLTDEQIASNMGINVATLYRYKNEHKEICEALKRGKEVVDIQVENSLFKKAMGYNAAIKKTFKIKDVYYDAEGRRCEKERLESAYDEVHVPADTTAQIFWLKNRKPDQWREKAIVENKTDININQQEDVKALAELILNPLPNRNRDEFE